jgi:hypothetical protein
VVAPQLIVVGVSETRFLEETWFLETLSTLKCSATLPVAQNIFDDLQKCGISGLA